MPQGREFWIRWSIRCVGFAIFAYLLHRIGPDKLWRAIRSVSLPHLLGALPIFFVMIGVKSLKMRTLMKSKMTLSAIYRLNAFAFSAGSITPGRLGEFSKIVFMTRAGISPAESFAVTLVDRLSDVGLMIVLAVGSLFIFFGTVQGWIGVFAIAGLSFLGVLFWNSDRFIVKFLRGKFKEMLEKEGPAVRSFIRALDRRVWFGVAGLTLVYLGLYFLQMWILARGLNSPIGYLHTAMAISASAVPAILPISVFNIGPRDAVLAVIFSNMGWGAENGVALSTLILMLFLINGIFGLMFLPKGTKP